MAEKSADRPAQVGELLLNSSSSSSSLSPVEGISEYDICNLYYEEHLFKVHTWTWYLHLKLPCVIY